MPVRMPLMEAASIQDDDRVTATQPTTTAADEGSIRYPGWRVVIACFFAAVFCWGFGLYGHGVYLTELQRIHGWPTSVISGAVTGFYLLTALFVVFISDAISRLGPRIVMLGGMTCFGGAVASLAVINAPWQLYLTYMVMAAGAATMHVGAISNVVGLWFDRKRPLAISLALNGASTGGILVTPALVLVIAYVGFPAAILGAMLLVAAILLPAIAFWVDRPPTRGAESPAAAAAATGWTRATALRSRKFWSVTAPFAMALTAQVGFLVHQIAIVEPALGRAQAGLSVGILTVTALVGRIVLGAWAGRLDLRRFTAWSMASQSVALLAMMLSSNNIVLLIACAVYGFSAGNLVTMPSLVIQREFETKAFGMLVGLTWAITQFTYAFGPGIMGALRDLAGSYVVALALCMAMKVGAGILILLRPRSDRAD
jgi:MFS family permease